MSEQKDISTDWQARAEQLVVDLLDYIKEIAPYTYAAAPRCIKLQDRAAELGIIPEVKR